MAFIQIIEFDTSEREEIEGLVDEWERATEGKRTTQRRILCQDRDDPGRYVNIVFFDSFESAMKNSALPETDLLAKKIQVLCGGPPGFRNLDVVEDQG
jgi:hypothetical protein